MVQFETATIYRAHTNARTRVPGERDCERHNVRAFMADYQEERHEITAVQFGPCGAFISHGRTCTSTRRFAIRALHIGLYCGNSETPHSHEWRPRMLWAKREDFIDGPFAGWVPADAFPDRHRTPKKVRRGGWDLSEPRRFQFVMEAARTDAACLHCRTKPFRGNRNSREALVWLRDVDRLGLYAEVADAIRKMNPLPAADDPTWYDRLPSDLHNEVRWRFDDAALEADHPFSIAFLQLARKQAGANFTEAVQRFAVDTLAMPLCKKCNRGRGARLFESESELLQRWADYRFGGNLAAAKQHPEHKHFELLARLAYDTDLVAQVESRPRQRRRKA